MAERLTLVPVLALLIAACAPVAPQPQAGPATGQVPPGPSRTLVMMLRAEPASIAGTILIPVGIGTNTQRRVFNAALVLKDGEEKDRPYLAETVPQLNTESWRVFPDGRMETTYRLKPNLTWHDGAELTANDFVFAWRVYTTPDYGISGSSPHSLMEEVAAPDQRTVVIKWRRPFPEAAALEGPGTTSSPSFAPLPRHILERVYQQERDTLPGHSFWTTEYVGAGPFKLERWEPGAFIEASAFDGHALGRPKIDHIRFIWNSDPNVVLAALLAGEAHVPADRPIRVQQGQILKREWAARNAGTVEYRPELVRFTQVQQRPEYANPKAVLDLRVRRALAHLIDKNAINETLFEHEGIMTDTLIPPTVPYFAELDRAAAKYPYDPRRSEQLMAEGGYTRGADGFYVSPTEGRLNFEIRVIASAQSDSERAIMGDEWRRNGFEFEQAAFTPAQSRDGQTLGTFRSLSSTGGPTGEEAMTSYTTASISRPETRWTGLNRGGWSNPEYDRLMDAFLTTLDRAERNRQIIQAVKILTENLGVIPLYFNPAVVAYARGLTGINLISAQAEQSWNVHEWEFR